MVYKVNWSSNIKIKNGPTIAFEGGLETEAYQQFNITLRRGTQNQKIIVKPDEDCSVDFLFIKSDKYGGSEDGLSFKFGNDTKDIELKQPYVLIGKEMFTFYPKFTYLIFNNETGEDVELSISIARNAVYPVYIIEPIIEPTIGTIEPLGLVPVTRGSEQIFAVTLTDPGVEIEAKYKPEGDAEVDVPADASSTDTVKYYKFTPTANGKIEITIAPGG